MFGDDVPERGPVLTWWTSQAANGWDFWSAWFEWNEYLIEFNGLLLLLLKTQTRFKTERPLTSLSLLHPSIHPNLLLPPQTLTLVHINNLKERRPFQTWALFKDKRKTCPVLMRYFTVNIYKGALTDRPPAVWSPRTLLPLVVASLSSRFADLERACQKIHVPVHLDSPRCHLGRRLL